MLNIIVGIIALAILGAVVARIAVDGSWEDQVKLLLVAFGGFVAFVFSETFAEYCGHYGWTRSQWYQSPAWFIKFAGAVLLLGAAQRVLHIF